MENIVRLESGADELFDGLYRIYSEALPPSEKKSYDALKAMLDNPNYNISVSQHDGCVTGFTITYISDNCPIALLEYMAVDKRLRSRGIGSKLFQSMADFCEDRVVLIEVDSPLEDASDADQRLARLKFYIRNNCRIIDGLNYILPLKTAQTPPELLLLIHGDSVGADIEREALRHMVEDIFSSVYNTPKDDERLDRMFDPLPSRIAVLSELRPGG